MFTYIFYRVEFQQYLNGNSFSLTSIVMFSFKEFRPGIRGTR